MNVTTKDGRTLSYWGAGASTGENYTTSDLLRYGDGRCGSWADLFFTVLVSQGINDIYKYHLNFKSNRISVGNTNYTYLSILQKGNSFQGNSNTINDYIHNTLFYNHSFNKFNNYYYDTTVKTNTVYDSIEDYISHNIEIYGYNNITNHYEKIEPYLNNITYSHFFSISIM